MEKIVFTAIFHGESYLVGKRLRGFELVDYIKAELGVDELKAENIEVDDSFSGDTCGWNWNPPGPYSYDIGLFINEAIARKSRHFNNKQQEDIQMGNNVLDRYLAYNIHNNTTADEIKIAYKISFDKERLISDWEKAGFPLKFK